MTTDLPPHLSLEFIRASTREPVVTVRKTDTLSKARTLMALHDFSQLPVVAGKGLHNPKGVISWESIGRQSFSGVEPDLDACIDTSVQRLPLSWPLADAIPLINRDGCVLVVNDRNVLTGIVTVADLGEALAELATPFLELERCEHLLREAARDAADRAQRPLSAISQETHQTESRQADAAEDLTMGPLVSVLGADGLWPGEVAGYDTTSLRTALGKVVAARNDVMHFRKPSRTTQNTLAELASINTVLEQVTRSLRVRT